MRGCLSVLILAAGLVLGRTAEVSVEVDEVFAGLELRPFQFGVADLDLFTFLGLELGLVLNLRLVEPVRAGLAVGKWDRSESIYGCSPRSRQALWALSKTWASAPVPRANGR